MATTKLVLLLAVALLAGCGNDDGDPSDEAEAALEALAKEAATDPSAAVTGFEAAAPGDARACLEKAGFSVDASSSVPGELAEASGMTDQLTLLADAGGTGSITYFESEEEAITAHEAELENQESGSVTGRQGPANYVYVGEDVEAGGSAILKCL